MRKKYFCILTAVLLLMVSFKGNITQKKVQAGFTNFITVDSTTKDKLMDGNDEFRFIGMNIQDVDPVWMVGYPSWESGKYKNPTDFELEDIVQSVSQMGGTVIRVYALSMGATTNGVERHVMGVDTFSDDAFERLDTLFDLCDEYGVRIILGLVDYQDSIGGVSTYAGWRSKDKDDFFTDTQLIADFKKTIDFVTNRYEDEKALLCWETGNEFPINSNTDSWTRTISAYIKSKDSNHLVADGRFGIATDALTNSNVDIVVNHLYHWVQGYDYDEYCADDRDASEGKKVYIVEEFGYAGASQTIYHDLLDEAIDNGTSGIMLWAMAHHNDNGGFYWHDGYSAAMGNYWTYHWPGFSSGSSYNETDTLTLVRNHAYEIRDMTVPSMPVPDAPTLLDIDTVRSINWQGSAGASSYDVERATSSTGPWTVVGDDISDAIKWKAALFDDKTAIGGTSYYYRVKANNSSGTSSASNVVGPVTASNTYTASTDFDENYVNGHKGWLYKSKDTTTGAYTNMYKAVQDDYWFVENTYATIGSGWQRPDTSYDSILSWTAPRKGSITISSTAELRNNTADGAYVCIKKFSGGVTTTLKSTQTVSYGSPVTMDVSSSVYVNAGDLITFEVNKKTTAYTNEYVDWDPTITFTLGTIPSADPTNLVSNPGFENETSSPWNLGTHFGHTSADYNQGQSSAALVGAGTNDCNMYQNITVEPYTTYTLEFYGKTTASTGYYIMDSTWTTTLASGSTTANSTWTKYTLNFETGSNTTVVLRIPDDNASYNYFDDFKIYKPTNLLANPGFESGSTSWTFGTHFTVSTADKFLGTNSVRLLGAGNWDCNLSQAITVTPYTNYTLRFYAKCGAATYYSIMNSTWTTTIATSNTTGNSTWTYYSLSFNSGNNSSVVVRLGDNNTSTNYFDDFIVY